VGAAYNSAVFVSRAVRAHEDPKKTDKDSQEESMSASHDHDHDDAHTGPIKTPKQLAWAVFFSFVVPVVVIIMLANYVSTATKPAAGTGALEAQAVAARIAPVGHVEVKDANDVATLATGDKVFQAQCAACHATGAAGAPKLGDAAAWGPRIKNGVEALLNSALKGKGNMGPQGGGDFSDFEIHRAVVYMANQGGAKFEEPKAPAPAASAAN
jgi:cytochrome c5